MSSSPSFPLTTNRVLITGGCGFIGLNLIDFMIKKGFSHLRILDNLSVGKKEGLESLLSEHGQFTKSENGSKIIYTLLLSPKACQPSAVSPDLSTMNSDPLGFQFSAFSSPCCELFIGDIRDRETCLWATQDIDAVIHLAAHAGIIPSIENPYYDFEVNILGTLNLLNASVINRVEKFIFASSNAPLGNQDPPLDERKIPNPLSPYGASKLACEAYCSAFYASYGLKTVVLRFSNAYGPYSLHKNSVIVKLIKDGLIKNALTIYGDGTQTRDFIHVGDLCRAIYLCLSFNDGKSMQKNQIDQINQIENTNLKKSIWGETFHLGTSKETSIINLAEYLRELLGGNIKIAFEPERKGEIKKNYSDISKARFTIGFEPKINLEDGVKKVYEWFMREGKDSIKEDHVSSGSE